MNVADEFSVLTVPLSDPIYGTSDTMSAHFETARHLQTALRETLEALPMQVQNKYSSLENSTDTVQVM